MCGAGQWVGTGRFAGQTSHFARSARLPRAHLSTAADPAVQLDLDDDRQHHRAPSQSLPDEAADYLVEVLLD